MSRRDRLPLCLYLALALLCVPRTASPQVATGTISATIVDQQGQPVPGVTVTIVNEPTNDSRAVVSDANGDFLVTNLQPSTYTVRAALQGFSTFERKSIVLTPGDRLSIGTVVLKVGGLSETVVVEATGTPVKTEDSQHSGVITAGQIDQVQVLGRDVTSIMRLLPGVRYEQTVDSLGMSFGTSVPNVGGLRNDWSNVIVDGVVANEVGASNLMAQQINLDAIAEVKVLLGSYRAEYGRAGGGQVQIVSKSGTSRYHGNLYDYIRNEALNSNSFFNIRNKIPKAPYRFNTSGANLGGPVPGFNGGKKLFFFYSIEAPLVSRPGPVRNWTMPTALERQGDFSQTLDTSGRLIYIKDPLLAAQGLACSPTTGGPGCFAGNIIPTSRINPNGLALLNVLPLPDQFDRSKTLGQYNYTTQSNNDNPKMNNIVRVDWRPSAKDSIYVTYKDWYSDQRGSEITAGPAKWGWFNTHYLSTDRGVSLNYTRVIRSNLVFDSDFGARGQTEQFYPLSEAEWKRIRKSDLGYTLGQFHPELNPEGVIPKVTFNVPNAPNFTFDNRLTQKGHGGLFSTRNNLTWLRSRHAFKTGFYFEQSRNAEGKGGVGGGPWAGQFTFSTDTNNPFDTNHSYANALIGAFANYTEIDAYPEVTGHRNMTEFYAQDTWKANRKLTIDYGVRFLWYQPWHSTKPTAAFFSDLYDPAKAPRLYQPARINNVNVAYDPVTQQVLPNVWVGAFVPGSGDRYNGMLTSTDPRYHIGFMPENGIEPEPRLGMAWNVSEDGQTALHASAGLYHNPSVNANGMDAQANNPPNVNTPQLIYGTMDTMFALGSASAFANRPSTVSGTVAGIDTVNKTPRSYNYSAGIQRGLGWGTVIDVTYSGSKVHDAQMMVNINTVPDGARFVDVHPENADPRNPAVAKPADFLRPYIGYSSINMRPNFGWGDYNSLQVQLNRRYIRGLQFAVAYTLAKTTSNGTSYDPNRPMDWWNVGSDSTTQWHNLIISYTWDIPGGSHLWNHAIARGALDGWQLSGDFDIVSGDWSGVSTSSNPAVDLTGGDAGIRARITGDVTCQSGNCDPNPDGTGSFLNLAAFTPVTARGDLGNAPRSVFRLPWITNSNLSFFKNFDVGGGRRIQIRWEMYNVFNKVQWSAIDSNARFNTDGSLANLQFGKATAARDPRIMQGAIRFSF
jgi:Carboxypeptidase regulatory-like domain/TonB-dependent Receptor Plug Domain